MKTKTLFFATLLSTLPLGVGAQEAASFKWIQTPFWKAPQASVFQLKLRAVEADLNRACTLYKKLINSVEDQTEYPGRAKKVDRWRVTPLLGSPMGVTSFEASFELLNTNDQTGYFEVEVDLTDKITVDELKEALPYFTQVKASTGASVQDISQFNILLTESTPSFTQFSRSLKLVDSAVTVGSNRAGATIIKIEGLDVACDLLNGSISIEAKVPTSILLPAEQMAQLESFYHQKLSPKLNKILALSSESSLLKAARLGFQMGSLIQEEFDQNDPEIIGSQIKGIIDALFIPKTLDPSKNLVEIDKKRVVKLESWATGDPLTIKLSL